MEETNTTGFCLQIQNQKEKSCFHLSEARDADAVRHSH